MLVNTLITWDSYNNGFQVTVQALDQLRREHGIVVQEVLYLQNNNLNAGNLAELTVYCTPQHREAQKTRIEQAPDLSQEQKRRINQRLEDAAEQSAQWQEEVGTLPTITQKRLLIKGVTDYQSIYDAVRAYLRAWTSQHDKPFRLYINVSPGTPQMHVAWLMLNASGFLPPDTQLWATQYDREKKRQRLEKINFKPRTYLSEILQQNSRPLPGPEANPNDVQSSARKAAIDRLEMYAAIQAPLLILGERGVGKSTLIRKHLHERIAPDQPYRELACGTFHEELFRSELFGYKKGAFTGAAADKSGILTAFKDGGILFLDEIHDLSRPLQRELIQVLQTGQFYPIGSDQPETARFRLITASNRSLAELSQPDCLAPDFFDRIAHVEVTIPPLRDTREDLPHFWKEVWKHSAQGDPLWHDRLHRFLQRHPLPGNFRDLQRLAARIYAFHQSLKDNTKAIEQGIADFEAFQQALSAPADAAGYFIEGATFKQMEGRFRRDLVQWAEKTYGNLDAAAEVLERKKPTLYQDRRWQEPEAS